METKQTLNTTFAVLETRTHELFDGPFYSMVNANRVALEANERAREDGRPNRYFVVREDLEPVTDRKPPKRAPL